MGNKASFTSGTSYRKDALNVKRATTIGLWENAKAKNALDVVCRWTLKTSTIIIWEIAMHVAKTSPMTFSRDFAAAAYFDRIKSYVP